MLRSSQALLKQMPTINNFIVHPPLPLDARQSAQLLKVLTTSFRQTLDSAHDGYAQELKRPRGRGGSGSHKVVQQVKDSGPDLSNRTADTHMHSVLTNPLFVGPSASSRNRGAPNAPKDPMDVFERAVAMGMMDTKAARGCLLAKKTEIIRSDLPGTREAMRRSGAGLKVLRWLVSSGTANNRDFLKDTAFVRIFVQFIVAEDLQQAVWSWIEGCINVKPHGNNSDVSYRHTGSLLADLIRAETKPSNSPSLDVGYNCLSRAAELLRASHTSIRHTRTTLRPAMQVLFHRTVSGLHHRAISSKPFDSFCQIVSDMSMEIMPFAMAHLRLFHPDQPSADPALKYLKQLDAITPGIRPLEPEFQTNDIRLGLNTARFLLEHENRLADAQWVMQYLQNLYPKQLGLVEDGGIRKAKAEEEAKARAESLMILENLSLG